MKRYKYISHQEFRGSIKGVNRFLKYGNLLHPEDVTYFKIYYPDRILYVEGTFDAQEPTPQSHIDPGILEILNNQTSKIDTLIDAVKSGLVDRQVIYRESGVEVQQDSIAMREDSIAGLVSVGVSDIEFQGEIGETQTEGDSVMDKISKLKKRLKN